MVIILSCWSFIFSSPIIFLWNLSSDPLSRNFKNALPTSLLPLAMEFIWFVTKSIMVLFTFSLQLSSPFSGLSPKPTLSFWPHSGSELDLFDDLNPKLVVGLRSVFHLAWSFSNPYQRSKSNFFPTRSVNNFWAFSKFILSFNPLWLVRSTSKTMLPHLLTRAKHRLHRPFSVFRAQIEAPRGQCSLKLEVTFCQKLHFFWWTPTTASVPMLIQTRISRWSFSTVHFFAPISTPLLLLLRLPHQ